MFTLITRATVVCDTCGNQHTDEVDGPPQSSEQILRAVTLVNGWQQRPNGLLWCSNCVAQALCGTYGHDWCQWISCRCKGNKPKHTVAEDGACGSDHRYCRRGLHYEARPRMLAEVA